MSFNIAGIFFIIFGMDGDLVVNSIFLVHALIITFILSTTTPEVPGPGVYLCCLHVYLLKNKSVEIEGSTLTAVGLTSAP